MTKITFILSSFLFFASTKNCKSMEQENSSQSSTQTEEFKKIEKKFLSFVQSNLKKNFEALGKKRRRFPRFYFHRKNKFKLWKFVGENLQEPNFELTESLRSQLIDNKQNGDRVFIYFSNLINKIIQICEKNILNFKLSPYDENTLGETFVEYAFEQDGIDACKKIILIRMLLCFCGYKKNIKVKILEDLNLIGLYIDEARLGFNNF